MLFILLFIFLFVLILAPTTYSRYGVWSSSGIHPTSTTYGGQITDGLRWQCDDPRGVVHCNAYCEEMKTEDCTGVADISECEWQCRNDVEAGESAPVCRVVCPQGTCPTPNCEWGCVTPTTNDIARPDCTLVAENPSAQYSGTGKILRPGGVHPDWP